MNDNQLSENKTRKILIIEDNEINRELLKEILDFQYETIEAENGLEGLNILKEQHESISLILLDVQMPVMNGYQFLEEFVSHEEFSTIPVIVVTGSEISEEERCLSLGASDFITKPYIPSIVLKRVEAMIRLREAVTMLQLTKYDNLTKIYSKNYFCNIVKNVLTSDKNGNYNMLLINIEDFSYLNDIYGEKACDELLIHIANSLVKTNQNNEVYGKVGPDRFAILWKPSLSASELVQLIEDKIKKDGPFANYQVKYAYYENVEHDVPVTSLINRLSQTITKIKSQYKTNLIKYTNDIIEVQKYNHFVIENMESALANKEFKVYYQPKHSPIDNKLCGAEALIRWSHPEKGMIPPFKFINVFEQNGFITNLDLYVFEQACHDLRTWIDAGLEVVPVSVNASRRDIMAINDISVITQYLDKYNIPKELIHIEVTESLCDDGEDILNKVKALRDYGFNIEIDDFGAGYSSLGMIADIPMNYLKLDMKFARSIEKQKDVVKMIINLAHGMNVRTIAEGVETKEQCEILRDYNCDYIQGYYYSKPICYEEFTDYIKKGNL